MAKNITRHVQHIKSVDTTTITVDGQDVVVAKLPEWGDLKDGEIAVNYNDGYETISIRNNNNEVVAFPNINTVNTLIDEKAQAALTFDSTPTANSTNPVTSGGIKTALDGKQDKMLIVNATVTGGDGTTYYTATLDKTHSEIVAAMQANKNVYIYIPAMFGGAYVQMTQITVSNTNAFFVVIGDELWYCHTPSTDSNNSCTIYKFDYLTGSDIQNFITSVWYDTTNKIVKSQDYAGNVNNVLTFDTTPTANSVNPVTSEGIKTYVDNGDKIQTLTTYQSSTPLAVGDTHDQALSKLSKIIDDNEIITARALTDLNDNKQDEIEDLDEIRAGAALGATALQTETQLSKGTTSGDGNAVTDISVNNHQITLTKGATFLTEHQDLSAYADGAEYDSEEHLIYLKHGNTRLANPINAADFIKDGMVNSVRIDVLDEGSDSSDSSDDETRYLIVTFNTDAGLEDIEIPLSDIFDSNLYYTKDEVNDLLSNKQDILEFDDEPTEGSSNPVTSDGIRNSLEEMALVTSAALNELNDSIEDIEVAIQNIQPELDFDDTPTTGSDNPVTSGGIKSYVDTAIGSLGNIVELNEPSVSTPLAVGDTYDQAFAKLTKIIRDNEFTTAGALTELYETKQESLTFDSTPTANSLNPVTSGGIKEYVDGATDDTLVIECSGDLNRDVRGTETQLTITNNITAADVIEAYEDGKKIEIRHTYVHSGSFDDGCIITSTISSVKTQTENNNTALIGTAINTGTPVSTAFGVDYRTSYLLNVQHNEQDDTNDEIGIGGFIMDHPIYIDGNNEGELILGWETLTGSPFAPKFRYYDYNTNGTGVVAYTTDLESITSMTEITYSDLVTAKNNNNLKPGTWYRITDYTTTTTQTNTQSANHPFDVIVLATSTNTLSEEARAIQHSGDTYFANSNLNAWKVWYCLENNKVKYSWADDTSIGGTPAKIRHSLAGSNQWLERNTSEDTSKDNVNYYAWGVNTGTASIYYTLSETPSIDDPLWVNINGVTTTNMTVAEYTPLVIGTPNGKGVIYRLIDEWGNDCPYDFKNIQFKRPLNNNAHYSANGTDTWVYTFNAYIVDTHSDNSLGFNLSTIGGSGMVTLCHHNIIKPCSDINNYRNIIAGTAGEFVLNDTVFLNVCYSLNNPTSLILLVVERNVFDVNSRNNTLSMITNNVFGMNFNNNVLYGYASSFSHNSFGHNCNNCKFYDMSDSVIGNDVNHVNFGVDLIDGYVVHCTIEDGVEYVTVSNGTGVQLNLRDLTILRGVRGTSSSQKTLSITSNMVDNSSTIPIVYQPSNRYIESV